MWTRPGPAQESPFGGGDMSLEKVANEFRVTMIGEKSVYVTGGTGNRVMTEVWALQVRATNGAWVSLEEAQGMTDDVVPYLHARMNQEKANLDVRMFGRTNYTPFFPFQP